jgi:YD repeat-containing protein
VITTNTYDELNRLEATGYNGSPVLTPPVVLCYDGQAYSGGACAGADSSPDIGRLTGVGTSESAVAYTYDARGRVTGSTQATGGGAPRSFVYTYNLDDTLETQTYPSEKPVTVRHSTRAVARWYKE